jgi:hypothetical protein
MIRRTTGSEAERACQVAIIAPNVSRTHPSAALSVAISSTDRSGRFAISGLT